MKAPNHRRLPANSGIALLIVLAFVVLITVLAVATFSRSTTNRQVANSDANSSRSDMLALGALDVIVSDFKQEIANGSTVSTVNNNTIYVPSSAARMMPLRSGNPAGAPDPIPNLVRRSVRSDSILSPPGVASRASAINSTTDSSLNGRSIATARWNSHYLIPRANTYTTIDSTPTGSFVSPDWVLVTRGGPVVQTAIGSGSAALNNSIASNSNYVIGRYSYAVYDEGGLIDANVAGYPSPTPSPAPASYVQSIGRKGTVAFADLTQLASLAQGQIDNIAGWRNYASVRSIDSTQPAGSLTQNFTFNASGASAYSTYVKARADGFLRVSNQLTSGSTDQSFPTRQSLLQFRRLTGFTQNALQYLGTFSRELNRPTWSPSTPAGSTINYAGQAETSTSINRDLATVRVTGTFTRADGTRAVVGEPLLKTRFPLTRINALSNTTNTTIQRDFGFLWNSGQNRWDYVGATGSTVQTTIERLDQVASESREPNFFELLKAVILSGSVGLGSGSANTFVTSELKYYITGTTPSNLLSADYQIMQIGANLIDAWDVDNIPTFINFAGNELAGVENLPYLNKLVLCASLPQAPPSSGQGPADAWLVPSLWNPHQNGSSATSTGSRIRVALTGTPTYKAVFTVGSTQYLTNPIVMSPAPTIDVPANGFIAPTPPKDPAPAPAAAPTGAVGSVGPPEKYYGFHFVFSTPPSPSQVNQNNTDTIFVDFGTTAGNGNIELQIQLPDNSYKTYQKWNITATGAPLSAQAAKKNGDFQNTNKMVDPEYVALDPRTLRFGVWGTDANSQGSTGIAKKQASYGAEDSLDLGPPANKIELISWSKPQGTPFTVGAAPADLSLYATNGTPSNRYLDLDGVQRAGDWTTDPNGTGSKLTIMYASAKTAPAGNYLDRPQILSAPFQSVAELGQVFRDQPWKTLALTIGNSGDAGLLDAFTLQDVAMIAGRTSLNTRQAPVLNAILSQAVRGIPGTNVIGGADVTTIANRLVTLTAATPMISKAELVTTLLADPSLTTIWNTSTALNPWKKEARECVVRAFSDACQTRTWNLMIDVIAQSGRYPPNATSLANFVVEGEKRYWLHIAIDRFTGEIIDQQLEAVYE